jgi:hypothetical protein
MRFGYHALTDAANGKIALVVDALDEGQLRSRDFGFAAGLKDLISIVSNGTALPATLFGRAAAAQDAWLILSEAGLKPALLEIEYFSDEQSQTYLKRKLPLIADRNPRSQVAFASRFRKTCR